MKKSILMLIAFVAITFASCKKEEQSSYSLDTNALTVEIGERHQFVVSRGEKVYQSELFDWKSSDLSIVNMNGTGLIQGGKRGKATISATYKDIDLKCEVTVK